MDSSSKTSPKDIFLHLLAIIALYVSAGSFIALLFQYINLGFPDPIAGGDYYGIRSVYSVIRWSIATLVIVFPAYLGASWLLNKSYAAAPAKKNLRIRKWLIYFTLFAAAIIIAGDLVALIFNLLGGELTARFLLKMLTILFVIGSVFVYYFWDLKRHGISE